MVLPIFIKEKSRLLSSDLLFFSFLPQPSLLSIQMQFLSQLKSKPIYLLQDFRALSSLCPQFIYLQPPRESGVHFLLCLLTLHSRISCCSMQTSGGLLAAQNSVCCSPLPSQKQQGVLAAGNQLKSTQLFKRQY